MLHLALLAATAGLSRGSDRSGPAQGATAMTLRIGIWLCALIFSVQIASAQKLEAPEGCRVPTEGKIYVRLISGLAFAAEVPASGLPFSYPRSGDPTATEPLGCPDNPVVETSLQISLFHTAERHPALVNQGHYAYRAIGNNVIVDTHLSRLERFAEYAAEFDNCDTTAEGIHFCRVCKQDPNRPEFCAGDINTGERIDRVGLFLKDPDNLTGPESLPWAASCMPSHVQSHWWCRVGYQLTDGLSLAYQFGSKGLKLDQLRAIDLAIRDEVLKQRAPDLDGPDNRR